MKGWCNVFTHKFKAWEEKAVFPHHGFHKDSGVTPATGGRGMHALGGRGLGGEHLAKEMDVTPTPAGRR